MLGWFNFMLQALQSIVSMIFQIDLGIGFTLGDLEIALMVIGIVASALIVRSQHVGGEKLDLRPRGNGGANSFDALR